MISHRTSRTCTPFCTALVLLASTSPAIADPSVARQWNELLLDAIRVDTPRPTVHARNLFHTSVAMYDAWAAFDNTAVGYLTTDKLAAPDLEAARAEAISFAAYRLLSHRFAASPGAPVSLASFDATMDALGYDRSNTSTFGDSPAALGNRIAQRIISHGLADGSNEAGNYADTTGYAPANPPLVVADRGATLLDPNRWQPLQINGNVQTFLTPHWDAVQPFALTRTDPVLPYLDPGPPPLLGGAGDAEFKEAALRVIRFSSWLDPSDDTIIDISPGLVGNNPIGTNDGAGHPVNPATGQPYASNPVKRGDWGRVLAEFWADGPNSETPPGHWNTIANQVSDHPLLQKRIAGTGALLDDLEWDVKLYLALNGAVHDSAVCVWGIKPFYDYVRPISMIRHMGGLGQSSDPAAPSYHPDGLPLEPGLVEVVTAESAAAGQRHAHLADHVGQVAILAWNGHPDDPQNDAGGAGWILAEDWVPYQADTFVTPPFAGYTSGHSTFSRAAAEVLAAFTGSDFFPGGLGEYAFDPGYLNFEFGPDEPITLQWATYFDAADEAGLSRLFGGIHVDIDDLQGRLIGSTAGIAAFELAQQYFNGIIPEPNALLLLALPTLLLSRPRRHDQRTSHHACRGRPDSCRA